MAPVHRLPQPTEQHWDWQRHAACRGMDVESFYHPDNERGAARRERDRQAKEICSRCPVIEPCREWARRVEEPFGVWGGESEDERRLAVIDQHRAAGARV